MKRLVAFFLSLNLLFLLCGCGKKEAEKIPEDTVIAFSEAMQALDGDAMRECLLNPDNDELLAELGLENENESESDEDNPFNQLFKSKAEKWAKDLQYEIVKVERNGDLVEATVKYTYNDASPIMQELIRELFTRVFDGSLDYLSDASEEEIAKYLELVAKEKLFTTTVEKTEETIQLLLVSVNDEWKITELPSEVYDIVTFNLYTATKELELLFSESTANGTTNDKTDDTSSNTTNNNLVESDAVCLKKVGERSYTIVDKSQAYDKKLVWDKNADSYYDAETECWVWYNTAVVPATWQYWYDYISPDYGDFGWMEHDETGWYIEATEGNWIQLPQKYETSNLWSISEQNVLNASEPATTAVSVPEPTPAPAPAAETPFDIARRYIDQPLDELTSVIGQPLSSVYGPSCLIAGAQDGQLQYDGFWIYTLKDGDTETVKDVLEGEA